MFGVKGEKMKIIAPDYYKEFKCIAQKCKHTCCAGWEIDIDEDAYERFKVFPSIKMHISSEGTPHIVLYNDDRCPFLRSDNLCQMQIDYGEEFLCQICRDHPRFRNYWNDRIEIGLGLACEEAARIILTSDHPLKLVVIEDDGKREGIPADEQWLMDYRDRLLQNVAGNGPEARLLEYLIYRHIADALYDDRLEERFAFVQDSYNSILDAWEETDGSIESLIDIVRSFSVKIEYKA